MTIDILFLCLLAIGFSVIIYLGRQLLKADNSFFYTNGKAMRSLDISMAIDREKFNERIQNLTNSTAVEFKKWLEKDFIFMPALYGTAALLSYFSARVYAEPTWKLLFYIIILGQIISFCCDVLENIILLKSLRIKKMPVNMKFFNLVVITKLFFPVLALFICFATLILIWFRFLFSFGEPVATLFFLIPAVMIFVLIMYTILKKRANVRNG